MPAPTEERWPPKEVAPAVRVRPPVKVSESVLALPKVTVPVLARVTPLVTVVVEPLNAKPKLPPAALKVVAYRSLLKEIFPVVAVKATLPIRSPLVPTAPWKLVPAELLTVKSPIFVPIEP